MHHYGLIQEHHGLLSFFNKMEIEKFKSEMKEKIIEYIKSLPFYFSRIFQVEVRF